MIWHLPVQFLYLTCPNTQRGVGRCPLLNENHIPKQYMIHVNISDAYLSSFKVSHKFSNIRASWPSHQVVVLPHISAHMPFIQGANSQALDLDCEECFTLHQIVFNIRIEFKFKFPALLETEGRGWIVGVRVVQLLQQYHIAVEHLSSTSL